MYDAVTDSSQNFYFEQYDVMISSDQVIDVIFPVTEITGKVTDNSGNNLETNLFLEFSQEKSEKKLYLGVSTMYQRG